MKDFDRYFVMRQYLIMLYLRKENVHSTSSYLSKESYALVAQF